jgi:hypothetical protein
MARKPLRHTGRPKKLISGGQTGVDRVALDVAIELGIPHGGWCPRGRRAEDGRIPACYRLTESQSPEYRVRTEQNVLDSDGTLIVCRGKPVGGTRLTLLLCRRHGKPCLVLDLDQPVDVSAFPLWLAQHRIHVLNVAGPRASQSPRIASQARKLLRELLGEARENRRR